MNMTYQKETMYERKQRDRPSRKQKLTKFKVERKKRKEKKEKSLSVSDGYRCWHLCALLASVSKQK